MRISDFPLFTLKESPADAELISHRLLLRSGMVRKLASGLYSWLPLGLRVLRKVEGIVRQEMNAAGALEILMPAVQPAELWEESGRWQKYGPELLRLSDRHQRAFCIGPTHEEVITDLIRDEIRSYKQLPINFYQIQSKFRDEIRPRFGLMRCREFIMKDAYSFHLDSDSLQHTYEIMLQTYQKIFNRIGLDYRAVYADGGSIGGNLSHEFHVLADSGEDAIAFSDQSDYAANVEFAVTLPETTQRPAAKVTMRKVVTPNVRSIEQVCQALEVTAKQCVKTLLVKGVDCDAVALLVRGDHQLNEIKAGKLAQVHSPLMLVEEADIQALLGCQAGSIGPVAMNILVIMDFAVAPMSDFVCGANEEGFHYTGVNWDVDLELAQTADLRNVVSGDPSPDGQGLLKIARGIEVGHVFQLGDTYTKAMKATVLDKEGKARVMTMGCYGIGISRIVAAAIEQNYDARGIIWPMSLAPFSLVLLPMNMHKSTRLNRAVMQLYQQLLDARIDVLLDDRPIRPGAMFADAELIGIPHRLVFSEKGLDKGMLEYKGRADDNHSAVDLSNVILFLEKKGVIQ